MFSEQALNWYPRLPTCINLARIPKDLKIHNLIRGPLGSMLMSSEMTEILSPLSFPLMGQNHASQCVLAIKGRADRVIEASCEEKEGKGRQKPRGPPVFAQGPSLSSFGLFTAWRHGHPPITAIAAKARSEWKPLDKAHLLLYETGTVQWVDHFHDHHDPFLPFPL